MQAMRRVRHPDGCAFEVPSVFIVVYVTCHPAAGSTPPTAGKSRALAHRLLLEPLEDLLLDPALVLGLVLARLDGWPWLASEVR